MNSSVDKATPNRVNDREPLLVAEAGVSYRPAPAGDAVAAWLDLMETVELMCPVMPAAEPAILRDCRL